MQKVSDGWRTPQWLFNELNREFNFDIDLCATRENSKCNHFCYNYLESLTGSKDSNCIGTLYEDFDHQIVKRSAFMNPPYSDPKPFIEKAWADSKHCKIVCLVKCDPSTKWWATFWDYNVKCGYCLESDYTGRKLCLTRNGFKETCPKCNGRGIYSGPKPGCEVRFFPKRIKFDPPQQLIDSGEVFKVTTTYLETGKSTSKWVQKCDGCEGAGNFYISSNGIYPCFSNPGGYEPTICNRCKGKGYKELSGARFLSALIIMDRRNV